MWAVSDRFLTALGYPQKRSTTVTITPPGGEPTEVQVESGSVTADADAVIRRKGRLTLEGGSDVFDLVSAPGSVVSIRHGLVLGSKTELVPVFTGEVTNPQQQFGTGTITLGLVDFGTWLSRTRFLTPFQPSSTDARPQVIADLVTAAKPGTLVVDESTDTGAAGNQVWDESRTDAISDLCRDGGLEAFFRPDGSFLIRDRPTTSTSSVWTIGAGVGGVLKSVERDRPLDRLYNTVVVRPSATDASQTWDQQIAQVTNPDHPRFPDKVGVVPYFYASPSASTAGIAARIARQILDRVLGTTETLQLELVSNPALDASDVIRVITPALNGEVPRIFQHFVDSLSLDLVTGDMSLATRSQEVDDA